MQANAILPILVIALITIAIFSSVTRPVSAHVTKRYGNIELEAGWSNEPPLLGENNDILVEVRQGSEDNATAVRNALPNMDLSLKYGGLTKPIDFVPSEEEGVYLSPIIPTRVGGPYIVVLKGSISGQSINDEIKIEDVEGKEKLSFPDTTGTDSSTLGPQIEESLGKLASDIDALSGMQNTIQDTKTAADRAYMLAVVGIGIGAAGIVIAAISLSRNTKD